MGLKKIRTNKLKLKSKNNKNFIKQKCIGKKLVYGKSQITRSREESVKIKMPLKEDKELGSTYADFMEFLTFADQITRTFEHQNRSQLTAYIEKLVNHYYDIKFGFEKVQENFNEISNKLNKLTEEKDNIIFQLNTSKDEYLKLEETAGNFYKKLDRLSANEIILQDQLKKSNSRNNIATIRTEVDEIMKHWMALRTYEGNIVDEKCPIRIEIMDVAERLKSQLNYIQKLENKCKNADVINAALKEENKMLDIKNLKLQENLKNHEKLTSDYEEQNNVLKHEIKTLRDKKKNSEINVLVKEIRSKDLENQKLKKIINSMEESGSNLKKMNEQIMSELETMKKENLGKPKKFNVKVKTFEPTNKGQPDSLVSELIKFRKMNVDLKCKLLLKDNLIKDQCIKINKQLKQIKQQEKIISDIEKQNKLYLNEKDNLNNEIKLLNDKLQNKYSEKMNLKQLVDNQKTSLSEIQQLLDEKSNEHMKLKEDIQNYSTEIINLKRTSSKYENQIKYLNETIYEEQQKVDVLKTEIFECEKEKTKMHNSLERVKIDLEKFGLKNEENVKEIHNCKNEILQLRFEIDKVIKEKELLEEQITQKDNEILNLKQNLNNTQDELNYQLLRRTQHLNKLRQFKMELFRLYSRSNRLNAI